MKAASQSQPLLGTTMEPRWVTGIVTTVKGMLANRARLKAEQERAAIFEKMDAEMRRQR